MDLDDGDLGGARGKVAGEAMGVVLARGGGVGDEDPKGGGRGDRLPSGL